MPLSGSFVKEQSLAFANNKPNYRIIVSLRSDPDSKLSAKLPLAAANQFIKGTFTKVHSEQVTDNFIEISSPAFSLKHLHKNNNAISRLYSLTERNLKYAINKFGAISLMHVHVAYPAGYVAALLSKKFNIPYIITEHMSPFPFKALVKSGKLNSKLKFAFDHAHQTIAVSNSLADKIASFGFTRPVVIYNMVDGANFYISSKKEKDFVFLTVGGLSEQKGIHDLLDAISIWSPENSRIKFKIAGTGPLADTLKKKSEKLGIDKYVEWVGVVDRKNIPALFSSSNVFVLPSLHETFGIVYAEAIASGKPVIATRCGGPEDIVNSSNGLLVDKRNPAALAKALEWMYNNWSSYQPQVIRKDFEDRFSQEVICDIIAEQYTELLTKNNKHQINN